EWNVIMTPFECAEVLLAIRQVASSLSSMWHHHFHLCGIKRLLFGVFEILDEGQLIEVYISVIINLASITVVEHADYLKLVKLTWGTLGITPKMHDILYGWVLFQRVLIVGSIFMKLTLLSENYA
ncbi:hypothetical protein R6Q59_016414, partial [Mikania micrantha]